MFFRAAAFRADAFAARFLGGEVGGVTPQPEPDTRARGGFYPRRIKRQKFEPRGKTLREMFLPVPPEPITALPEIVAPVVGPAAAASPGEVPIGTFAPDMGPLIEGLQSLRAALDAQAVAQAVEEDDAEILLMVQ